MLATDAGNRADRPDSGSTGRWRRAPRRRRLLCAGCPSGSRGSSATFDPTVVLAQSPFEAAAAYAGRALARRRVPVVVELHGDWASFARLYGSRVAATARAGARPARRVVAPPRRRRPHALAVHDRARAPPRSRARRHVHDLHRPVGVRRSTHSRPRPSVRPRSSSASSSATRTWTGSSPPGGSRRLACRTRGSSSSARGRCAPTSSGSSPTSRSRRRGTRLCRRPRW